MNRFFVAIVLALVGALVLAGCGSGAEPKVKITVESAAPTSNPGPVDTLGPRYDATLAQGIDFRRQGYPNFLAEVEGMSGHEPWGRWSEGKRVTFRFNLPLPEKFTLALSGGASGPNIGRVFKIRIGSTDKDIVFTSDPFNRPETHRIPFILNAPTDAIQISVPEPSSPPNGDTRKLGMGVISLRIES